RDDARYRSTLANGATIEVVAVSTHPSGPGTWWRPDGSPLPEAPADRSEARIEAGDGRACVVLVRVSHLPEGASLRWLPTTDGDYWGLTPTREGHPLPGMEMYAAAFGPGRASCEIKATVASGPWKTEIADDGSKTSWTSRGPHEFYFGKARANGPGTALAV